MTLRLGARDTAKDIMLGTAPSGNGPKLPRDTGMVKRQERRPLPLPQPLQPLPPPPSLPSITPPDPRPDPNMMARLATAERSNRSLIDELTRMRNDFNAFQHHQNQILAQEQEARRRLEAALRTNNDSMARMTDRLSGAEGGASNVSFIKQDLDETKHARARLEADLLRMQQELVHLKGIVDRQNNDLMLLNSELKSRPVIDPSKMNNTQQLEAGVRDIHGQMMSLRQSIDGESTERRKIDQEHAANLSRLQAQIADQEARKNDILRALAAQENSKNSMNEEAKRLNAKIALITDEVTRNMIAKEQKLREENSQHYLVLEKAIRAELDARLQYERDVRQYIDIRWKQYDDQLEKVRHREAMDRAKQHEKIGLMGESLAVLERHLAQGNRKVERVLAAEIQSRKANEKVLLSKLGGIEDQLSGHVGSIHRALDNVRDGQNVRFELPPMMDMSKLREELEAISSDKHKLTMEGMLKLEERMNRIERGMDRDTRELQGIINDMAGAMREKDFRDAAIRDQDLRGAAMRERERDIRDAQAARALGDMHMNMNRPIPVPVPMPMPHPPPQVEQEMIMRLRQELQRLEETQAEVYKAHEKLKERLEKTIPHDIQEVEMKRAQTHKELSDRVAKEEQTRYAAVKELEDEVAKVKNRPVRNVGEVDNKNNNTGSNTDVNRHIYDKLQSDVDQCQVGIKKLAESVTTVKNVLDKKITTEARQREKEVADLQDQVDKLEHMNHI